MGRSSLLEAVNSVKSQSFTDWELIVVNASGTPLALPPHESWSAVTLWIETGHVLDRGSAANQLLGAAGGQYAIFLDDDDWFLKDHLGKLVKALDADQGIVAAYGDVECLADAGTVNESVKHRFERDFDVTALQLENYLPIHAVMFRMDSVRIGRPCAFEPALQLFEDWDFWLQLSKKGAFQRVPGVSAIYALSAATGSGHTESANEQRIAMLTLLSKRQLERWQPDDAARLILHEVKRVNQLTHEKQVAGIALQQAEQLRQYASEREAQLALATQALNDLHVQLHLQQREIDKLGKIRVDHLAQLTALMDSTSWRITRPLRQARGFLARIRAKSPLRIGRNLLRALACQIARHGVLGFIRRIPYFVMHREAYFARMQSQRPAEKVNLFEHAPPRLRDLRLHPDLLGQWTTIDAKVSVVIPTFNAGAEFVWMLRKLRTQKAIREIEIVVVDSGSSDRTVATARQAGAKVVEILPSEFTHSYSRNLGADHATGDFLLIMVQDAYPIGDLWMYGMLRFLLDHADMGLVAASCAEYSRADSDMMYDSMINTHYRFLGCLEVDRIGEHKGDDHMALRSQGQLSDVSCLISRECFQQFRYRGDYAEDLDLGIRLIQSGRRVAMLASIKVIHSHNRPAFYYLKRSFVDVIFLVGMFDDFFYPRSESLSGLIAGMRSTAQHITRWFEQLDAERPVTPLGEQLSAWIAESRRTFSINQQADSINLGEDRLDEFLSTMSQKYVDEPHPVMDAAARAEAQHFNDSFLARLEHFLGFAAEVYGSQDALLRGELGAVVRKTFAATAGSALAYFCLSHPSVDDTAFKAANRIREELTAGV